MTKLTHFAFLAVAGLGIASQALAAEAEHGGGKLFGVLETSQGSTWVSGDSGDVAPSQNDYYASQYALRIGGVISEAVQLQADVDVDYGKTAASSLSSNDNLEQALQFGFHVTKIGQSASPFGLFGGLGRSQSDADIKSEFWFVGAETRILSAPMSPYLQIGFLDGGPASSGEAKNQFRDALFLRGVARQALNANVHLQLAAAYANGVADTDEDRSHVLEWGARIDWSMAENLPIFLAYRGNSFQNPDSSAVSGQDRFVEQSVYVGLTYHFGNGSGKNGDADLGLPAFGRWVAAGEVLD